MEDSIRIWWSTALSPSREAAYRRLASHYIDRVVIFTGVVEMDGDCWEFTVL